MKSFRSLIGILVLFLSAYTANGQFVKRINCGGPSVTNGGITFEADDSANSSPYSDGELISTFSLSLSEEMKSIRYTKSANRQMFYKIPVPGAGQYQVKLHFAEPYWGVSSSGDGIGVRVFDVSIQGNLVADDLDVIDEVGPHAVHTIIENATVVLDSDNEYKITIDFDASGNDPIINAIEVFGAVAPTLTLGTYTDTEVNLSWTGAVNAAGIAGYRIYRSPNSYPGYNTYNDVDGETAANVTTYTATGLTANTGYSFRVVSLDAAGNEGPPSDGVGLTTNAAGSGGTGGYWTQTGSDIYYDSGNVGIGTSNPSEKLDVNGDINIQGDGGANDSSLGALKFYNKHASSLAVLSEIRARRGVNSHQRGDLAFYVKNGITMIESMRISSDGNLGIGTSSPGTWKLAVKGNIRAEEIKVETGWADYVFDSDYELPTLKEVEKHIKEKGHLINIPSAQEVEVNGILLGEMNKLLLEKIEELTLYIIEQDKAMDKLQNRVSALEIHR